MVQGEMSASKTNSLLKTYLWTNQAAYSISAFSIGCVLSIAPLYLKEQLGVAVATIGWMMGVGEIFGICAMKIAEMSEHGFIFRRPYDLHFIIGCISLSLMLIPVWSPEFWYLSCIAMMTVQTFNAATKPVLGESMHRLSVLMERAPSKVFAQANMWRRIGNATIALTTFIYIESPTVSFYAIGGFTLLFLGVLISVDYKIKSQCKHLILVDNTDDRSKLDDSIASMRSSLGLLQRSLHDERIVNILIELKKEESSLDPGDNTQNDEAETDADTTMNVLNHVKEKEEEDSLDLEDNTRDNEAVESLIRYQNQWELDQIEGEKGKNDDDNPKKSFDDQLAYLLIVYAFPFWDGAISRLPFAWLTIAVLDMLGSISLAALVIFGYQMSRAFGQSIQAWKCNTTVNYILNGIAFTAYIIFVIYIEVIPDGTLWYIPFFFAGLAETLPVQQQYLIAFFGDEDAIDEEKDDMKLRHAVKASHTSTGIGSMTAFVLSSQMSQRFELYGVAYLGVSIMCLKLITNLVIDYLLYRRKQQK